MDKEQGGAENLKKKRDPGKIIEVLFKISEAVGSTDNLDEFYKVIHKSLDAILNVDNFYIALYDDKKDSLSFPFHVDEKDKHPEESIDFKAALSYTGRVIQKRTPLIFDEADILKPADDAEQNVFGAAGKIRLGAPLMINDRIKG